MKRMIKVKVALCIVLLGCSLIVNGCGIVSINFDSSKDLDNKENIKQDNLRK